MTLKDKNNFIPLTIASLYIILLAIICYATLTYPQKTFLMIYFMIVSLVSILVLILLIIGNFCVAKHFDKTFKEKLLCNDDYDELMWQQHLSIISFSTNWHKLKRYRFYRAVLYIRCLAFPNITKNKTPYNYIFKGYDFRTHANVSSLIIGYTFKAITIFYFIYAIGLILLFIGNSGAF